MKSQEIKYVGIDCGKKNFRSHTDRRQLSSFKDNNFQQQKLEFLN
ncbi:hypothetical protein LEP1GSC115_5334 [Leptospira interrogans serovar Australis str. 200703203]|uniref:Transposase domain protein n=1 Tax=Leptospira interrogans serovar Australis str. 200703203 TaxID=1085541 RepID=N1UF83_LEPIR|nr:hypothetical protein LEP1GSC115_5334 [Leptospira interrogans serovar Australis str. 200703203]